MNIAIKVLVYLAVSYLPCSSFAQEKKINIREKNISFQEIFAQIEKQTGYSIAYGQSNIDITKKITLSLKDAPLDKALIEVLKTTGLTYKINGYHIILTPKTPPSINKQQAAPLTQNIRGTVTDAATGTPVAYATVSLLNQPATGTVADSLGRFTLTNIRVGRHDIKVTAIGYEPYIFREILLTSSREAVLDIPLKEDAYMLEEVVVSPGVNKEQPLNPMALNGGRMISMEEAGRFAGALDDPARLVTSFAGVAKDFGTNAMSIHGNPPQYTQWRLEGVEITNPTHFSDMVSLGGGTFTALSSHLMGNSDFFNGAFPAEYGNALAGVFDMNMRTGNTHRHQHTLQIGTVGIDMASEGPVSKKNNSSYIVNYRYSTTALFTANAIRYQDLAFKLNFPTPKAGTFSLWGIGLIDYTRTKPLDHEEQETYADRADATSQQDKAVAGLSHKYHFTPATSIKTTLAATYTGIHQTVEQINSPGNGIPTIDITNKTFDLVFNSYINIKFSPKHTHRTGVTLTRLHYDLNYNVSPQFGLDLPMQNIAQGKGESLALSAYSSSIFHFNPRWSASVGINFQYFDLNQNLTVEPRVGMKWNFVQKQSLSLSYGLHSRRERLDYYFVEYPAKSNRFVNKTLDLSKAHYLVLSYDWSISPTTRLKIEPYYQYLFDIPVEPNSSFSVLNLNDFYLDKALTNSGEGRNYGIDLTLERYMDKGYYYLLTGSVFHSQYLGGDHVWRDTRLNRNYIFNALGGKEWLTGKNKNNMFNLDARLTYQGGDRYTPVDISASEASRDIVWDDAHAFSKRFKPSLTGDITIGYKLNKRKVSHAFSLKILNIGNTGQHGYQYNEKTKQIEKLNVIGIMPDISYKIYF